MSWEWSAPVWMAIGAGISASGGVGSYFIWKRRPPLRAWSTASVALFLAPLVYTCFALAGLFEHETLYWERIWASPLGPLAGLFALYRFSVLPEAPNRRQAAQRVLWPLIAFSLGLATAGLHLALPARNTTLVIAVDTSRSMDLVDGYHSRIEKELQLAHSGMRKDDRLAVVSFATTAHVQSSFEQRGLPPSAGLPDLARNATNLQAAIERALSEIPDGSHGRIALLSDGLANRGDVETALARAAARSVPVDTVVLEPRAFENVRVVKVSAPPLLSRGEPFELRVVLEASTAQAVSVRIIENDELSDQTRLTLQPGQDVYRFRRTATQPGLAHYRVLLTDTDPDLDQLSADNQLSTFVQVRGPSRALLLTSSEQRALPLLASLQGAAFEVDVRTTLTPPLEVSTLARYDLVILDDHSSRVVTSSQRDALVSYVKAMGGGLLLLGSSRSLGPGGYAGTSLETVSPVTFEYKQRRYRGRLAQVIAIDHSGSMAARVGEATKLDLAHAAALRSAQLMAADDWLGILHVDVRAQWTAPLGPRAQRELQAALQNLQPGGGGIDVPVALEASYGALRSSEANLKHLLLFADGSDAEGAQAALLQAEQAYANGITTSVVALGAGTDLPWLERISDRGGGRFHLVRDATRLPAVFAQETLAAAGSALHLRRFEVTVNDAGGVLRGIDWSQAPPLFGYVVTVAKPRARIWLRGPHGDPLLATWSIGLGRVGVFTSNLANWGAHWTRWPGASQLFAQLERSLVRTTGDTHVQLRASATQGRLDITADVVDQFALSQQQWLARVFHPNGDVSEATLSPEAPGRHTLSLPIETTGPYLVSVFDAASRQRVATTGAELTQSDELKPAAADRALLEHIARRTNGISRDTLAGVFLDPAPRRQAQQPLTLPLLWASGLVLLLVVALRQVPQPRRLPATPPPRHSSIPPRAPLSNDEAITNAATELKGSTIQRLLERRRGQ